MNDNLQIIVLILSLVGGIIAIMFSNQLARKYKLDYLYSYFYYLIFLFVFGVYGIVGSRLIRLFLENQGMEPASVDATAKVVTFIGFPFLFLSWYMFIRLVHEMVNLKISRWFNLVFFTMMSIGFLGYGFALLSQQRLPPDWQRMLNTMMMGLLSLMTGAVYGYSLIQLFIQSGKYLDQKDRHFIRLFGINYAVFIISTLLLLNLSPGGIIFGLAFLMAFFTLHLLPIFFLSLYLDQNFVEPSARVTFEESLQRFIRKYEISKRESEVVTLICKGKSNQDISESLFISLQTVKDHTHRIYLKTGVRNRVQLANLIRSTGTS